MPAALAAAADRQVERYAITGRSEQPVRELSGGNQQKVVVARALAGRPRVLVAMHPTRGLDVAAERHGTLLSPLDEQVRRHAVPAKRALAPSRRRAIASRGGLAGINASQPSPIRSALG